MPTACAALSRRRPGGERSYYTSAAWVRILRLSEDLVADPKVFASVYPARQAGSMAALDEAVALSPRSRQQLSRTSLLAPVAAGPNPPSLSPQPGLGKLSPEAGRSRKNGALSHQEPSFAA